MKKADALILRSFMATRQTPKELFKLKTTL